MILRYLYPQFLKSFALNTIVLLLIFAFSDLMVRMATLPSLFSIPLLFACILPLVALFAFPIASMLAIQTVIGRFYLHDEVLLFRFLPRLARKMTLSVLLCSITITALYTPLVFYGAPLSYWYAKTTLIHSIKEQFSHIRPNVFHNIVGGTLFFFKETEKNSLLSAPVFKKIVLSFKEGSKEPYFITAQQCSLQGDSLVLLNGSLYHRIHQTWYVGTFNQTEIHLDRFFVSEKLSNKRPAKFLTMNELAQTQYENDESYVEFHKRWAQVMWQFFFCFLALWIALAFGQQKSNLLISVFWAGGFFLFSYISLNVACLAMKNHMLALIGMYGPLIISIGVLYCIFKKRWQ